MHSWEKLVEFCYKSLHRQCTCCPIWKLRRSYSGRRKQLKQVLWILLFFFSSNSWVGFIAVCKTQILIRLFLVVWFLAYPFLGKGYCISFLWEYQPKLGRLERARAFGKQIMWYLKFPLIMLLCKYPHLNAVYLYRKLSKKCIDCDVWLVFCPVNVFLTSGILCLFKKKKGKNL